MGSNLRLLRSHIGLSLTLAATSEAAGFPASNLETGNLHRFWKATSTADQTLTYDAGVGNTKTCDTVVLPRADKLVTVAAHVVVERSTDMSVWATATGFTALTPIVTGDLAQPDAKHYIKEFTAAAFRGWRIKLYGTPTAAVMLAGGLFLGPRDEVPVNPLYGRPLGWDRAHLGAEVELAWGGLSEAQAEAFLPVLAALNPGYPAESPHRTVAGTLVGGLPHWLYDPLGTVFRRNGTPMLWPALCLTPENVATITPALSRERGPSAMRWGKRV